MGIFWYIIIGLAIILAIVFLYKKFANSYKPHDHITDFEHLKNNPMALGLYKLINSKTTKLEAFNIYFSIVNDSIQVGDFDPDLYDVDKIKEKIDSLNKSADEMINIALKNTPDITPEDKQMFKSTHVALFKNIKSNIYEKFNII